MSHMRAENQNEGERGPQRDMELTLDLRAVPSQKEWTISNTYQEMHGQQMLCHFKYNQSGYMPAVLQRGLPQAQVRG